MKDLQKRVDNWIKEYGVRYFDEKTNALLLVEETGELMRIIARIYGEQSFKREEEKTNALDNMADEMADIIFVICCIANQTGIDLEKAINNNFLKKTRRDHHRHKENDKLNN